MIGASIETTRSCANNGRIRFFTSRSDDAHNSRRRPAMALDADQGLDRSPCRTPGGEVGEIAVGDITFQAMSRISYKVSRRSCSLRLDRGSLDLPHAGTG
jgi:hypothetical protein